MNSQLNELDNGSCGALADDLSLFIFMHKKAVSFPPLLANALVSEVENSNPNLMQINGSTKSSHVTTVRVETKPFRSVWKMWYICYAV